MKDTESLRKLMELDAGMNTTDIEDRFGEIAEQLFRHFAIQQGERLYLFKEIEFYGELASLLWYLPKNGLKEAIVTTETITTDKVMESVVLHFMPAACYAYTVGENTLRHTRERYGF